MQRWEEERTNGRWWQCCFVWAKEHGSNNAIATVVNAHTMMANAFGVKWKFYAENMKWRSLVSLCHSLNVSHARTHTHPIIAMAQAVWHIDHSWQQTHLLTDILSTTILRGAECMWWCLSLRSLPLFCQLRRICLTHATNKLKTSNYIVSIFFPHFLLLLLLLSPLGLVNLLYDVAR